MSDPAADSARLAAEILSSDFGAGLSVEVEAALHASDAGTPQQYIDPVSIGALIVSVAQLAWTIYTDRKDRQAAPSAEVIARTVRVRLDQDGTVSSTQRERMIEVVVEETVKKARGI